MQFLEPVRVPEGEAMQLRSQIDAGGRFTVTWRTADADPWKPAAGGVVEAALPLSGRMPVAALAADLPPVTAMDALYFANRFVTWGPVFKTVVSAAASDSQALLRLALPPVAAGGFDPASLTLDPRLLNGVLFGAFALLTQRGVDCALLPLSIIRLRANAAAAAGPFWINVRLVRLGGEMITVEADIADADGALVLDCEGFGFKRPGQWTAIRHRWSAVTSPARWSRS
jgi:hypothetical protein